MDRTILLVAGDPSADLHGANLIKELKKISPDTKIFSLGGVRMSEVSDGFLYNLVELAVFGVGDSVKNYFRFRQIFQGVVLKFLDESAPDCVVLLDFYGFNIHLAQAAKKRNIPVIYYISPQVWASRPGRVRKLARYIDKMVVILPFEEEIYRRAGVDTVFLGHPLLDVVPALDVNSSFITHNSSLNIGLLPGSRRAVISRHLPLLFAIAKMVKEKYPQVQFFLPWTKNMPVEYIEELLKESPVEISLVYDEDYEVRKKMKIAFACSGTATLENALLGIPTVIIYKTTWFFYLLARSLIRVPYIGLVNILSGKNLFPEFIQHQTNIEKIVEQAEVWLTNPDEWEKVHKELTHLREKLGKPGVSRRIAEEISKVFGLREIASANV